ncbi:MAG TPA: FAD-dependent oxidoreductase [Planctomycetota bacterium]|nr:FAD-dependent oxidoreductase [Planctomycetota bacterium]
MTNEDAEATENDTMGPFAALAEPIDVAGVTVRNRVVFPAMATGFASPEGFFTERAISYYLARARGGVGLIIVEPVVVAPEGRHISNAPLLDDDKFVQMHARLCEVLHAEGVTLFVQLMHAGRKTGSRITGAQPVGPSAEADPDFGEIPVELTDAQIGKLVEAYVSAAARARRAGYDGVELLASGGFLLHQFLSSESNHREDGYGGELAGRARVLTDVISGIRSADAALPVSVRVGPGRRGHYHLPLEELLEVVKLSTAAGASCINVALGAEMLPRTDRVPIAAPGQVKRPVEPAVKDAVDVPVIGGGNLFDLAEAGKLVRERRADMIALGRPLITDPKLPAKLFENRLGEIRPCIRCNVCLGGPANFSMTCPANPMVGREQLFWLARRGAGHHVVVVGAGLAGLWSALVAAELGYTVELFEPGSVLGNLLALRSRIPGQTENYRIVDFLSRELHTLGVKVHLRRKPTVRDILEQRPSAVFVAHIGELREPDIDGLSNIHAIDPVSVLSSEPTMGEKIVLLGGGLMGAELAYYLAKRAKRVALLEERTRVASDTHPELRQRLIAALKELDCPVYVGVHDLQVNIYGELTAHHEGRTLKLLVDTIILTGNYEPCDTSYGALEGKVKEMHLIGDAYETAELTRLVYEATGRLVDLVDRL